MDSSIGRVKSLISNFLGGIMLWMAAGPPMQNPKQKPRFAELGLKTLMYTEEKSEAAAPLLVRSYKISSSKLNGFTSLFRSLSESSSYSSWSSALEDLIGSESGVYMSTLNDKLVIEEQDEPCPLSSRRNREKQSNEMGMGREYPAPIPLLARTENLAGHMPWVLVREYENGKLRLKVEKVKHHEYIESHREDNRLILNLVSMEESIRGYPPENMDFYTNNNKEEEEEEMKEGASWLNNVETSFASSVPKCCFEMSGRERCGDLRRCFTYAGTELSEFNMFSMIYNNCIIPPSPTTKVIM